MFWLRYKHRWVSGEAKTWKYIFLPKDKDIKNITGGLKEKYPMSKEYIGIISEIVDVKSVPKIEIEKQIKQTRSDILKKEKELIFLLKECCLKGCEDEEDYDEENFIRED